MQNEREKTRKIEDVIVKYRLSEGFPPLKRDELRVMVAAWAEHLRPVATAWITECYLRAYKVRDPDKPFSAGLILKQWLEAVQSGDVTAMRVPHGGELQAAPRSKCPYGCSEAGFYVVDRDGNPPGTDYSGYTYARTCPVHRPNGIPIDLRAAPHSTPPWAAIASEDGKPEKKPTWPRP